MAERDFRRHLQHFADALRHPLRLRLAVCGVTLSLAYFAIYGPLSERTAVAARDLREAELRATTAHDLELLRAEVETFRPRLAPSADPNESLHYVLDGVRALPLRLVQLDAGGTVTVGPYQAVVLSLEVNGEPRHLDALVAWLETNPRLFRIDTLQLDPSRRPDTLPTLRLRLLALKG